MEEKKGDMEGGGEGGRAQRVGVGVGVLLGIE